MSNLSFSIDEVVGQHQTIYDVYFSQADSTGSGVVGALDAANFLKLSKLKDNVLKDIWELTDPTGKGYLDRHAFYISLKLVALAQSNQEAKLENVNKSTPAPKLGELSSNITSLISPDDPWYIKASARLSYDKIFDSLSPINNKISGTRVKPFLMNSGLPVDILGKIWELSDLDQDGQLDRDEFLIGLQLINKAKEGNTIPDQLPPSLLPFKIRHSSIPTASFGISATSGGSSGFPLNISLVNETKPWVVTFEEKSKSDVMFNQIDTDRDGYVSGLECKDIFLKTGLSQIILANIWSLCDIGSTGKLNCEQFALAMHFINKKIATGLDAPPELLPEMVPPSLRPKPILTEEAHVSKEFEELQTQVTELQREKLYYEQRASEHDMLTRQKRTELSNLELEMESLFKTLQDREMKKSEEQKKLAEFEDKMIKLDMQLKDLKEKYESERSAIEKLKLQIHHMEAAMRSKDTDLNKIKTDLQNVINEQSMLETKLITRKDQLNELNNSFQVTNNEITKNKCKIDLLKLLQTNLNKLIKEYDQISLTTSSSFSNDINDEIKQLEEENLKLSEQIKQAVQNAELHPFVFETNHQNNFDLFNTNQQNTSFSPTTNDQSNFNSFFSPQQQNDFQFEDPFQKFDPFNTNANSSISNDPFKSAPIKTSAPVDFTNSISTNDDPFATAFDPFSQPKPNSTFGAEDPFNNSRKAPPPRPAPPRPQTPSLKPTKKPNESARPQSALDFTRNNKLDLFNDFNDPFQSANTTATTQPANKDLFGAFNWDAFNNSSNTASSKTTAKDPFDPFG